MPQVKIDRELKTEVVSILNDDYVSELIEQEKKEPIASFLGIKLEELRPGYAKVSMKIRKEFLNFNNYVFGGIIMSLADQAFAYATNSLHLPSIASQVTIYFLSAPKPGDTLTGECMVIKKGKRIDISEMKVTDHNGRLIAKATGTTVPVNNKEQ
jgi:acyl-CoA thioesterase